MLRKIITPFILTLFMMVPIQLSFADSDTLVFENMDYSKSAQTRVFLEGREISFAVSPQSINGRIMVPMRTIFQEFGMKVVWSQAEQTITATGENISIVFKIGGQTALVNYAEQKLDAPARTIKNTTMIPLRFLSENMGYNLVWNSDSNMILLSQSNIVEWRYGGYEKVSPYKEYEVKYYNGARTEEMRYTGQNHEVKFYTIYTENGKISQNVPEYNLSSYGQGWLKISPFEKRTFWIDARLLVDSQNMSIMKDFASGATINTDALLKTSNLGNLIKVTIEKQYFDIDTWRKLSDNPGKYDMISSNEELDGEIIASEDVLFKVIINDSQEAVMLAHTLLKQDLTNESPYHGIFFKDPATVYLWSQTDWERLKGNTAWVGMNADMLKILKMKDPDKRAQTETKFSNFEIWAFEDKYAEAVYLIKDGTVLMLL